METSRSKQDSVRDKTQSQMTQKQIEQLEKMKTNRQRDLLRIEPEERDVDEIQEIMDYMGNVNFFKQYKNKPEYYELCKQIYIETFEQGQTIFKQGDSGDSAYVILTGEIVIYIDEPTEYRGFMTLKEKARLQKGTIFGQLALKNNQKRTATAKAGQTTDLIVIEKEMFNQYFADDIENKPQITPHLRKLKSFLEGLDMFALMPTHLIDNLTTKCDIKRFPSNTIILKQGNDSAALYFVRQGKLKVVRLIPFKVNPVTKEKIRGDTSDPTTEELQNGSYINEFIEIDELSDQDIFGDYSLLYQTEQDHSIITSVPSELVYINIFYINQIIPEDNLEVYKKSLKKYPNNTELRLLYWEKRNWESYRNALMSNIILNKSNKKTFHNQLRKPLLRTNHRLPPLNSLDIKTSDSNLYFQVLDQEQISKSVKAKKKIRTDMSTMNYNRYTQTGQNLSMQLDRFGNNVRAENTRYSKDQLRKNLSVSHSLPSIKLHKQVLQEANNYQQKLQDIEERTNQIIQQNQNEVFIQDNN